MIKKRYYKYLVSSLIIFIIGVCIGRYHLYLKNILKTSRLQLTQLSNTKSQKNMHPPFKEISIENQKAIIYTSTKSTPQPLIISLHTWSGNYLQDDPIAKEVLNKDWHYIHPNFQGKNDKPDAALSQKVIGDLDNAITYMKQNHNYSKIIIIGVSGGGYTALGYLQRTNLKIDVVSSWSPVTDLVKWYYESKARKYSYYKHIELITQSKENILDKEKAKMRSPIHMNVSDKLKHTKINIYAGIHDGYTGSIPISHSLLYYNKLLNNLYPDQKQIPLTKILNLVTSRSSIHKLSKKIQNRSIHFQHAYKNLSITIFEGGHELLEKHAVESIL